MADEADGNSEVAAIATDVSSDDGGDGDSSGLYSSKRYNLVTSSRLVATMS